MFISDDTLKEKDFFGVRKLCTPQLLFKHKVHYGHKASSLDPGMKQFVYGIRSNHVIFDLDITNYHLQEALNVAAHIALREGIILFVARLPQSANLIETTAKNCGEFAHTRYFIDGDFISIFPVLNGASLSEPTTTSLSLALFFQGMEKGNSS